MGLQGDNVQRLFDRHIGKIHGELGSRAKVGGEGNIQVGELSQRLKTFGCQR